MEKAGGTTEDIGHMTVFLKEESYRDAINKEWLKMFPDEHNRPARHANASRPYDWPMTAGNSVGHVKLHRVQTDVQAAGDLPVAQAVAYGVDHTPFGAREDVRVRGTATAHAVERDPSSAQSELPSPRLDGP